MCIVPVVSVRHVVVDGIWKRLGGGFNDGNANGEGFIDDANSEGFNFECSETLSDKSSFDDSLSSLDNSKHTSFGEDARSFLLGENE